MKNDFAILRFSKIRNCGVDPLVEMGCPRHNVSPTRLYAYSGKQLIIDSAAGPWLHGNDEAMLYCNADGVW